MMLPDCPFTKSTTTRAPLREHGSLRSILVKHAREMERSEPHSRYYREHVAPASCGLQLHHTGLLPRQRLNSIFPSSVGRRPLVFERNIWCRNSVLHHDAQRDFAAHTTRGTHLLYPLVQRHHDTFVFRVATCISDLRSKPAADGQVQLAVEWLVLRRPNLLACIVWREEVTCGPQLQEQIAGDEARDVWHEQPEIRGETPGKHSPVARLLAQLEA
jgi:hypothetical protein